jgi:chromosome segregation ATPase
MGELQEMDRRLSRNENDIEALTRNLAVLTSDVDKLVRSQQEIHQLFKDQAVQRKELDHFRESLSRAFTAIETVQGEQRELTQQIAVSAAVDKARVGFASFLLRYWHILMMFSVAGAAGGYIVK